MASSGLQSNVQQRRATKSACTTCARRKVQGDLTPSDPVKRQVDYNAQVKCDREEPACSNCVKHHVECRYEEPAPPQRHTKRRADAELQARLNHLEQLLQQRGIDPQTAETTASQAPFYKAEEQRLLSDPSGTSKPHRHPGPASMANASGCDDSSA